MIRWLRRLFWRRPRVLSLEECRELMREVEGLRAGYDGA
jgi:hypothetical protein